MINNRSAASADAPLVSPLVSIVMLAFNQRDMVEEAMASLQAQGYPNFELVVGDDGVALHDRIIPYRRHTASFSNRNGSSISVEKAKRKAQRISRDDLAILRRFHAMIDRNRCARRSDDVDLVAVRRMEDSTTMAYTGRTWA